MQVKEVEREVVTEVKHPQVKTLYRYQGQGMGFEKGEVRTVKTKCVCYPRLFVAVVLAVLQDQQRLVGSQVRPPCPPPPKFVFHCYDLGRRGNGQEGFVPANYVKEVEPAVIKKVSKRKEMVSVPVTVTRKKTERR